MQPVEKLVTSNTTDSWATVVHAAREGRGLCTGMHPRVRPGLPGHAAFWFAHALPPLARRHGIGRGMQLPSRIHNCANVCVSETYSLKPLLDLHQYVLQ